jgi:hypothetical protein
MTTPQERTRSLRFARELAQSLLLREDTAEDVRRQARVVLRHFPSFREIQLLARDPSFFPWLAPEEEDHS